MTRTIRVRYEGGVFRPLEPVEFEEGKVLRIVVIPNESAVLSGDFEGEGGVARRFYGVARRRMPGLSEKRFHEVIEEVENEDIRGL